MANTISIPVSHRAVQPPAAPPPESGVFRNPIAISHRPALRGTTGSAVRHAMAAELTGLRELGPAPARGGARGRSEPTDFDALPSGLHVSIAAFLAPRDQAMLASTNRNLRDTLWPMSTSHRLLAQAAETQDLATFRTSLRDTLAMADGPALQVAACTALATWIGHIPSMQMDVFREFLQMCAPMQPRARATALAALGPTLSELPADLRNEACQHLLDAIGTLPTWYRTEPLRVVATRLATLPAAKRDAVFDAVLRAAVQAGPGLQAAVLDDLADQVGHLPSAARLHSFQGLLDAAADHQPSRVLDLLGPVIAQLPRNTRPAAFRALRLTTTRIPQGERGAAVATLASHVAALPRAAQQAASERLLILTRLR